MSDARGRRVRCSVHHEKDFRYGTDTLIVNGVPISFKKMPDTKPPKPKKNFFSDDEDGF